MAKTSMKIKQQRKPKFSLRKQVGKEDITHDYERSDCRYAYKNP